MTTLHTPGMYFERRAASSLAIGLPRTDIAAFAGIAMRGPVMTPVKVENWTQFVSQFGGFIAQAYLAYAVHGFFANGGRTCWIVRVADFPSSATAEGEFGGVHVSAGSPGSWGNGIQVHPALEGTEVVALMLRFPDGSEQYVRGPFGREAVASENLFGLPQNNLDAGRPDLPLVVLSEVGTRTTLPEEGMLTGGADGLSTLTPQHFITAIEQFGEISEIGIVAVPDLMPKLNVVPRFKQWPRTCCSEEGSVPKPASPEFPPAFDEGQIQDLQIALAAHAQIHRYRFAMLDAGEERANVRQVLQWRGMMPETSFAAMYYPWILVDDPLRLTGLVRAIPPSGHLAGIFARSDHRRGVHKPPMNEVLESVVNVAMPIDDLDHGLLNDKGINVIRVAPGRGVRIMGSRTLWGDIVLRYINVRRLLSMIERALEQSLQWTVFEPNTHLLYRETDRVVRSFLEGLFRAGVLDGATSEEAYFVRCDKETNPLSEVEQGRVNCHIGIQPPYPAEFVVVTIGITKDGVQVREGREQNV